MSTEFDPQGRVYWGPHALSFPSAIWFDTSAQPHITMKINIGGDGSQTQYLDLATFDQTDPNGTLTLSATSATTAAAVLSPGDALTLAGMIVSSDVGNDLAIGSDGLLFQKNDEAVTPVGLEGVSVTQSTPTTFDIRFDTTSLSAVQIAALKALIDTDTNTGEVNTIVSVGGGESLFKQKTGSDLELFSLDGIDGITVNQASDVLSFSFDTASLTAQQLGELSAAILPPAAVGVLSNDGTGLLSWEPSNTQTTISFGSTSGTIANTGTANDLDLDIVSSKVLISLADYLASFPDTSISDTFTEAALQASDPATLHEILLEHYNTTPGDRAALQALLDTDSDTRVVVSFADTTGDGQNDVLRIELYAIEPSTGASVGAPLSTTDLPLTTFASGVIATETAGAISGDGSTAAPITLTDSALATALNGSASSAAIQTIAAANGPGFWDGSTLNDASGNVIGDGSLPTTHIPGVTPPIIYDVSATPPTIKIGVAGSNYAIANLSGGTTTTPGTASAPFTTLQEAAGSLAGQYFFDFGDGPFQAYIDADGWMLWMQYIHRAGTQPNVRLITPGNNLPNYSTAALGADTSGDATVWGHGSGAFASRIPDASIRLKWDGQTSGHSRRIHFESDEIGSFRNSGASFAGIETNFTPLASHSAQLPAAATLFGDLAGDLALAQIPFYGSQLQWFVGSWNGGPNLYRVDDTATDENHTIHRIWVKPQ